MILGVIALGRPTFDVTYAEEIVAAAWNTLANGPDEIIGSPELLMDADAVDKAVRLLDGTVDALMILQATFADSTLIVQATDTTVPIVLWAFPEERTGERLRLNSFCGINLGGYALTNLERPYRWVYRHPDDLAALADIAEALSQPISPPQVTTVTPIEAFDAPAIEQAIMARDRIARATVGRVGDHPAGFEPCSYEASVVSDVFGATIDAVPLPVLFDRSEASAPDAVEKAATRAAAVLTGIDALDTQSVERSLRLGTGLRSLVDERGWSGVATRCWPETFTEFGGAACTPMSLLNDVGVIGTCEADVYGNITGLVMQWLAGSAAFVTDLVHLDRESNTGVFWHCGLAPFEMADPAVVPRATVHSNRKLPLLSEFPLKPGRVTLARFSRSRGIHRLVIGAADMISAPLAFSGTAGVARFDRPVAEILDTVMGEGLEHHYGIVYGDVREELAAVAALLAMPVIEL
ncbi:MAG: hypothetical protein U9N78_11025 [Actinomycetota bacterium]|nr:hypothetical protein [Actinomycetota bacterium]